MAKQKKIIQTIEGRMKSNRNVAFLSFVFNIIVVLMILVFATKQINKSRENIYVLNGEIPMRATSVSFRMNRPAEYKSHVDLYHSYFFNVFPDDKQIEVNIKRALYLVDQSGMQQFNSLKEKGFYSQVISSNSYISLTTDSIILDNMEFTYYGKQKISRRTSVTVRNLITKGRLIDAPRTDNNPHGVQIIDWRTIENKDLEYIERNY